MLYNKSAEDILNAFNDPQKDKQYFYNYVLGLPYIGSDDRIEPEVVLRNCEDVVNPQTSRVIIGADTGHGIHYSLMNNEGVFYYEHATLAQYKDPYDRIEEHLKKFPRSIAMFDQGGDLIGVRKLQAKYPGRVFLCWYRKDRKTVDLATWGQHEEYGKVIIDRNRLMTLIVEQMRDTGRIRLNGSVEEWEEWASHFGCIYREQIKTKEMKDKDDRSLYSNEYVWKRNGPDHYCIRNGADVPTKNGVKKIEDVQVGDQIMTRKGWRSVLDAFKVKDNAEVVGLVSEDGHILWATPDHKLWVTDKGWTRIDKLELNDKIVTCTNIKSFSMESSLLDIPTTKPETSSITHHQLKTSEKGLRPFTKKFGRFIMAPFLRGTSFITKTVIQLITRLKIWIVSQEANIIAYTLPKDGKTQSTEKKCLSYLKKNYKTLWLKKKTVNNWNLFGKTQTVISGEKTAKNISLSGVEKIQHRIQDT